MRASFFQSRPSQRRFLSLNRSAETSELVSLIRSNTKVVETLTSEKLPSLGAAAITTEKMRKARVQGRKLFNIRETVIAVGAQRNPAIHKTQEALFYTPTKDAVNFATNPY